MREPAFALDRRGFLQSVGTGLLVSVAVGEGASRASAASGASLSARLVLDEDGGVTAFSGKVEEGQGPRAELTQAAAEELRVPVERVRLVMADTDLVPDDGITAGSRTTPRNVPEMRLAAATAREVLVELAATAWSLDPGSLEVKDGTITAPGTGRSMTYADLAKAGAAGKLDRPVREGATLTPVRSWASLGQPTPRPHIRDLVTGAHRYPSDVVRPGMLYGRVLRPPAHGVALEAVDLAPARAMDGVFAARFGPFVGVAAPTSHGAARALAAVEATARWTAPSSDVTSETVHAHLRRQAREGEARARTRGAPDEALADADRVLSQSYQVAYIEHAPMEPRAAVAEWDGDRLTVWAGCDGPFRAQQELAEELAIPRERVRVIVPDMGGGFGGKHTAEPAVEAARLARGAGKPVRVQWTREEEFTWAYCRPAAVIDCRAGLSSRGSVTAWDHTCINAGGAALDTPYAIANVRVSAVPSDSPLPQGSYRALGSTANNFARESFMDELASAAGADPLEFRLAHLENARIRTVLEKAAREFDWSRRRARVSEEVGVGLACGTEKDSVVAACVEVVVDRAKASFRVTEVCEAFECGPILNPANLLSQVQGCIVMGLGGALFEELEFDRGALTNPRFSRYRVPRFRDVPRLDIHLVENRDISPAGAGETPIIAVAPAIANAVFAATGLRLRSMPMKRLPPALTRPGGPA